MLGTIVLATVKILSASSAVHIEAQNCVHGQQTIYLLHRLEATYDNVGLMQRHLVFDLANCCDAC